MNRRWLTGMMFSLVLAVCLPAHAIVLTYAPHVDELHKQKASMSGRMETAMEGLGQPMRGELSLDMDYTDKALSQTDAVTRVQTDIVGGKGTVTMAGQSQAINMPTGRMVADVDRRNRVVKMVEADVPGGKQMMGGAENFPNWSQYGAFPEGDVSVNDTWSGTVNLPASQGMPAIDMTYKCTLLEFSAFQGHKCAKIRTSFSGPFKMDMSDTPGVPPGTEGTIDATLQGDIVWYYDYENSIYVYGEGTVAMDMKMSMAGAGNMTTKMLMNIKTALQP